MKKTMAMVMGSAIVLAGVLTASAKPAAKAAAKGAAGGEAVAEGFAAWSGVNDKNWLAGRMISASDLRQRTVVVVIFEADKAFEQLGKTGMLASMSGIGAIAESTSWEKLELPRDVIVLYSCRGNLEQKDLMSQLKSEEAKNDAGIMSILGNLAPVYKNVTFPGEPDNDGQFPYVYVLGYMGAKPEYKGVWDSDALGYVKKAVANDKARLSMQGLKWRPFYGFQKEVKSVKSLPKLLKTHKPLKPAMAEAKKGFNSTEDGVARECQIVYDAIEQTKSDLLLRIKLEATACPHRAAYDMDRLLKYWPTERKRVADVAAKLKSQELKPLVNAFIKLMTWSDPTFEVKPAEFKKIAMELAAMKKQLEMAKALKNPKVAAAAELMISEIDGAEAMLRGKAGL